MRHKKSFLLIAISVVALSCITIVKFNKSTTDLACTSDTAEKSDYSACNAKLYGGSPLTYSDWSFKRDIRDLDNALSYVLKLRGVSYTYKGDPNKQIAYGYIADEVREILPDIVYPAGDDGGWGVLALAYDNFTPLLSNAIKEQQAIIESQQATIETQQAALETQQATNETQQAALETQQATLEAQQALIENHQEQIDELKSLLESIIAGQTPEPKPEPEVEPAGAAIQAVLYQNQPNPWKETTEIRYEIPEGIGYAAIYVSDLSSNLIKTLPVTGSGSVQLDSTGLEAGIYAYSLVVDGKVIDTKKFILTK